MIPESDQSPVAGDDCARTARSMALRMLCGAGSAELLAYNLDPMRPETSLAHGISAAGQLVVAACPSTEQPLAGLPDGIETKIRLDISKQSADPQYGLTVSSVHLLGVLHWLAPEQAAEQALAGGLPERVADLACVDGGRLGVIEADRVLIHDYAGVRSFGLDELVADRARRPEFPAADDELDAQGLIRALAGESLRDISDAVLAGQLPGRQAPPMSMLAGCPHTWDQTLCADVDRTGLSLLTITPIGTHAVFAAFDHEVTTIAELRDRVVDLIAGSALLDLPRI